MADPDEKEKKRESGAPGGGAGRKDEVGGSGVYPMSGPHPKGKVPIVTEAAWGQGARGAAGYEDSGESALWISETNPEQCRDIMSKDPICCVRTDTVVAVAGVMREYDIGEVPVVDNRRDKRLLGVVTDRDLTLRVLAEHRDPGATTVEEVMTPNPVTCSPDDDLRVCLDVLEANQIRRVPVTDNAGRIVGIIAQADIALRMRQPEAAAEVVREVSKPRVARGGGSKVA